MATDAGLAEGRHDIDAEEGHPADEEDAHNDAHSDGRLVVRDVVGRRLQLLEFELRLVALGPANAAVLLLLGQFPGTRDRADRLDVLLCVAIESGQESMYVCLSQGFTVSKRDSTHLQ